MNITGSPLVDVPQMSSFFFFQVVFNVANELLKTANQNPRLALHKAKAGWILLGALMTLGEKFV